MAESRVSCVNCDLTFVSKDRLLDHARNAHGALKVECECGNRFDCETAREQHFNEAHLRY